MGWKDFFKAPKQDTYYAYSEEMRKKRERENARSDIPQKPEGTLKKEDVPVGKKEPTHFQSGSEQGKIGEKEFFSTFRAPIKERKDCIVFVIENSIKTREYSEKILGLTNKIVQSNNHCFFVFLRIGDSKKFSTLLDYQELINNSIFKNLFDQNNPMEVDYLEVLQQLDLIAKTSNIDFEYKNKKCEIQNINIIFFGTGTNLLDENSKEKSLEIVQNFKSKSKVKTIKYFCMEDNQTIEIAKLGFPVIGHIEADFYK